MHKISVEYKLCTYTFKEWDTFIEWCKDKEGQQMKVVMLPDLSVNMAVVYKDTPCTIAEFTEFEYKVTAALWKEGIFVTFNADLKDLKIPAKFWEVRLNGVDILSEPYFDIPISTIAISSISEQKSTSFTTLEEAKRFVFGLVNNRIQQLEEEGRRLRTYIKNIK